MDIGSPARRRNGGSIDARGRLAAALGRVQQSWADGLARDEGQEKSSSSPSPEYFPRPVICEEPRNDSQVVRDIACRFPASSMAASVAPLASGQRRVPERWIERRLMEEEERMLLAAGVAREAMRLEGSLMERAALSELHAEQLARAEWPFVAREARFETLSKRCRELEAETALAEVRWHGEVEAVRMLGERRDAEELEWQSERSDLLDELSKLRDNTPSCEDVNGLRVLLNQQRERWQAELQEIGMARHDVSADLEEVALLRCTLRDVEEEGAARAAEPIASLCGDFASVEAVWGSVVGFGDRTAVEKQADVEEEENGEKEGEVKEAEQVRGNKVAWLASSCCTSLKQMDYEEVPSEKGTEHFNEHPHEPAAVSLSNVPSLRLLQECWSEPRHKFLAGGL